MNSNKYLKNTAILFASMTITKIVGALFKIPLANVLGGTGMGYFSTAYGLYSPVFAVTAAGIPTVMMRLTAQNIAANRPENAVKTRRTAMLLFSLVGLGGTLIVALFSSFFAEHVACSPESTLAVIAISPAVMLCCIASVIRGYHEGMSDVMPSAAASVAEAVSRAIFGLAFAYGVIFWVKYRFENGLDVFGNEYASYEEAYSAALPYAAAGAILAVSISELCGLISLLISDRRSRTAPVHDSVPPERMRKIAMLLLKEIVPVAASALVMNCVSFVDLLTVTRTLKSSALANSDYFLREFGGILSSCGGLDGLANFMYGSYTGIAMTMFMLIPSFAGMTEKTAIPEIAAAWERKDIHAAAEGCCTLFRAAATIGFPACVGAAVLGQPLLSMLYSSRAAEVSVCARSFVILCIGGMFMIIASALFGVFQAVGKAYIPLLLMCGSVAVKAALNPILMSIPQLNISGAAISTALGYMLMAVAGVALLKKHLSPSIRIFHCVKTPLVGSIACGATALCVHRVLLKGSGSPFCVIISVICGAIIYGLLLIIGFDFRKKRQLIDYAKKNSQKHLKNP
ncbi:MAG: polysaccharide biosynthesis C-terminal domain-containing protein [Oscillospiraceae bacterium]